MQIHEGYNHFPKKKNAIVTIGIFDGVHLAHRKLLTYVKEKSLQNNTESILITFWPHPRTILQKDFTGLQFLSTQEEKVSLIKSLGIDHLVIIPFTLEFAEVSAYDFIQKIVIETIGAAELVLGYDHHFGKNREGDIHYLYKNKSNFDLLVTEIPMKVIQEIPVNSSNIRKLLLAGKVKEASNLLGRNYSISGKVVKGKQLGRTIGYPTANISIENKSKLIPANGVYAVTVELKDQHFKGMLNIGLRPTVDGKEVSIEVNIFDFQEEIYGQELTIHFVSKLREEQKFNGLEELKKQLALDKIHSIQFLSA